jgi:hypothetical protein
MLTRRRFLGGGAATALGLAGAAWADEPKKEDKPALTPEGVKAVAAGLAYLAKEQHADGSFGRNAFKGNLGVTSLAGLAFLADGHVPGAGKYGAAVGKAVSFLLGQEQQQPAGYLHNPNASPHGPMYGHAFGTLFLARVAGNDADKERSAKTRDVLKRAAKLLVDCQNRDGGWRYTPQIQDADISVTGGVTVALRAARDAGCEVPKATLEKAAAYVKRCQDNATGGFRYMAQGAGMPGVARTAVALAALQAAGAGEGKDFDAGVAYLMKNLPGAQQGARPDIHFFYGHLYAARALQKVGGAAWAKWYPAAAKEVLALQREDGSWQDNIDAHYGTAAACLTLLAANGVM